MKTLKNRGPDKINRTPVGAPQPSGPASTPTDRAAALTPQTRTVHRTPRRRPRKNTQRNTRQTNTDRKQAQNNRRTTQNKKIERGPTLHTKSIPRTNRITRHFRTWESKASWDCSVERITIRCLDRGLSFFRG